MSWIIDSKKNLRDRFLAGFVILSFFVPHFMASRHYLQSELSVYPFQGQGGRSELTYPNSPDGTTAASIANGLRFPLFGLVERRFTGLVGDSLNSLAFALFVYSTIALVMLMGKRRAKFGVFGASTWLNTVTACFIVGALIVMNRSGFGFS